MRATQRTIWEFHCRFMSTEQVRGELVDRRADIWAFGCILYQCLTLVLIELDAPGD